MTGGKCGENLTWTLDYRGTLTISGTGEMEVPHLYGDEIPWFKYREQIKNVIISDGVSTIDRHAFYGCVNLSNVEISDSVVKIGEYAFENRWDLKDIKIPKNVAFIGSYAFRCCTSLTEVTIPNNVNEIGFAIFYGCKNLKKIYYPAGRRNLLYLDYGNNAKLIPYNTAPPSAQIKPSTTKPANERKFIPVVNQTPKPIAEKLRWKVEGKTLTVGGVREIKDFSKEEPPWVDSIDDIQKIVIEEGIEKISANAFIDCRRLELLTIPASVKTIGDTAFTACYCGNRLENGGRNIFWCLEDGVLIFKKNPAAKSDSDFSIDVVSWLAVEKNITGFKLEPGVVPKEKFFDRLAKRGNALHVSFS